MGGEKETKKCRWGQTGGEIANKMLPLQGCWKGYGLHTCFWKRVLLWAWGFLLLLLLLLFCLGFEFFLE